MPEIPADYRALEASEEKPRPGAKRIGPADPGEVFTVSVRVRRRPDAPPLPDVADFAATPRRARQQLSREDFAARYGASEEDLEKITRFARAHGLEVVESSIPRRTVVLKGTAAQMSQAFAVDLGRYEGAEGTYRGREGAVHVPSDLAGIVEGVFGLDNRPIAKPRSISTLPAQPLQG